MLCMMDELFFDYDDVCTKVNCFHVWRQVAYEHRRKIALLHHEYPSISTAMIIGSSFRPYMLTCFHWTLWLMPKRGINWEFNLLALWHSHPWVWVKNIQATDIWLKYPHSPFALRLLCINDCSLSMPFLSSGDELSGSTPTWAAIIMPWSDLERLDSEGPLAVVS